MKLVSLNIQNRFAKMSYIGDAKFKKGPQATIASISAAVPNIFIMRFRL